MFKIANGKIVPCNPEKTFRSIAAAQTELLGLNSGDFRLVQTLTVAGRRCFVVAKCDRTTDETYFNGYVELFDGDAKLYCDGQSRYIEGIEITADRDDMEFDNFDARGIRLGGFIGEDMGTDTPDKCAAELARIARAL